MEEMNMCTIRAGKFKQGLISSEELTIELSERREIRLD